ncbi:LysM peptidoglycan-binding domain-containing protein [Tenacibaculum sp. IB213877]|uniref:LysM peptidoglycan-binding domain-containing protein n=1 Tax=Tenacibaculum sp. IB213877 TaxID=3097351 RepID=UPI002A5A4274|nr:LysM peptidoglycan-binding domain-containing protein [Tenacibaculum sp. IB213877]MDY0779533.1 LysM peptidoglycan-binding domain-containing protein [Tenacibaculum sp. IB213877]
MKRGIILLGLLISFSSAFSQEKQLPEGWDKILLEGKIAYMNLVTGDVSTTFPTKAALKPEKVKEFDPTIIHKVEKGETLSTIARKYNMNLAELYRLNSLTDFDKIEVGDEIVIGYRSKNQPSEDISDNTNKNNVTHIVETGDTLFKISKKHNVSVGKIKELNSLTSNSIFVGQKLRIK